MNCFSVEAEEGGGGALVILEDLRRKGDRDESEEEEEWWEVFVVVLGLLVDEEEEGELLCEGTTFCTTCAIVANFIWRVGKGARSKWEMGLVNAVEVGWKFLGSSI